MNGRARLSIVVAVSAATCVGPGGPPSPGGLGYRVPSPPAATYRVDDSTVVRNRPLLQEREITTRTAVTLDLTFARDSAGIRVIGAAQHFEVDVGGGGIVVRGPSPDVDDLEGTLEFVLGPRGDVEVTSLPELPGPIAGLSPFASIAHELFPRLPDGAAGPGTTWVDTVAWSSDAASSEIAFTHAYTYTLVGDTVVDGRSLLNISFAGEVAIESSGQVGQRESTSSSRGSATGLILWDVERGLPVYGEIEEKTEGTTIREGLPPSRISRSKLRRIRLEG